jgi:hypothetical protein
VKGVNSELMAQPGFSPGACLLAAVFRPQSEPHRHVKGGRPFEQAPRLPLGQIRLRDRQIAAASSPLRPRLGRRLSQLIFQRVVALLAGSRYESTHPVVVEARKETLTACAGPWRGA